MASLGRAWPATLFTTKLSEKAKPSGGPGLSLQQPEKPVVRKVRLQSSESQLGRRSSIFAQSKERQALLVWIGWKVLFSVPPRWGATPLGDSPKTQWTWWVPASILQSPVCCSEWPLWVLLLAGPLQDLFSCLVSPSAQAASSLTGPELQLPKIHHPCHRHKANPSPSPHQRLRPRAEGGCCRFPPCSLLLFQV